MNYYLDLSDNRFEFIKSFFENKGLSYFDFSSCDANEIKDSDVIILSPAYKLTNVLVSKFHRNITLFAGNVTDDLKLSFREKNITYINFMEDEEFVLKNASLTSEAMLCELLTHTKLSFYEMRVLILGGGRVAKAIGSLFEKLKLNYNLSTIEKKELFNNKNLYSKNIEWRTFKDNLKEYNVIINTIPAKIFCKDDEKRFLKNSFLFEVSSSRCLENENPKDFRYILCPALPSRYTSYSAGELIKEVIEKNIDLNN